MSEITMWEIEDEFYGKGYKVICGVDEAGRGPLAGPVCAAAVILPEHHQLPGLNDSKKLTDKKRRELFPIIKEHIARALPGVTLINPAKEAAKAMAAELSEKGMLSSSREKGTVQYFVSDDPTGFSKSARIFLGESEGLFATKV